jgi:hypothetical protein
MKNERFGFMKQTLKAFSKVLAVMVILVMLSGCADEYMDGYRGDVFSDVEYSGGVQVIPGKVQCEFYDVGGEGVGYHDTDGINSGSGGLNAADGTYLHEFRIKEAVDTSYTKTNGTDDSEYNFVKPKMGQLYVGWTEPGEWMRYTVKVQKSGTYSIGLMYTANGDGEISLSVDGADATGAMKVPSTHRDEDKEGWRQWHHWNYVKAGSIELEKGTHVLTLHTVSNGNMNYDYLEFTLIN